MHKLVCSRRVTLSDESVQILHSTAWRHLWAFFRLQKWSFSSFFISCSVVYISLPCSERKFIAHACLTCYSSNLVIKLQTAFCLFMIRSIFKKKLPFEVLYNAVREKPAKLEELAVLKVRLWLVLEYFRNVNFQEFWYWTGEFSSFWTKIPGGPAYSLLYT